MVHLLLQQLLLLSLLLLLLVLLLGGPRDERASLLHCWVRMVLVGQVRVGGEGL